ncbi:RagB/SusD family nutrient uptake outer membrane protein [Persicobacter diffluens]|uniref:Outer membrane protein n=1 Tax=Persicobacter diffluens TaxID=981 RepID=A0AAN4VW23_9BACT|nr:outer membrane protein [Persicobacter diffluens]
MKLSYINKAMVAVFLMAATLLTSCLGKLDLDPIDPNDKTTIDTEEEFFQYLVKLYAGLANTGQGGNAGGDLGGGDEGATQYWRVFWNAQEFPTDEVVNTWTDEGAPQMSFMTWSANNPFVLGLYNRIYYQISATNEFLRQAKNAPASYEDLPAWKAEARFLRAYSYWHALDFFGNKVPFVTEEDPIGKFFPNPAGTQERGEELFMFIEKELKEIVGDGESQEEVLPAAKTAWLGRADKGAAYMVLAKLYLNHAVYLGGEVDGYYQAGRNYLNKMIAEGGYSLYTQGGSDNGYASSAYQRLFMADNERTHQEAIFMIMSDGLNMTHWGGTTYMIAAATGGEMDAAEMGIGSGWAGNRTTKTMVENFDADNAGDRAIFATEEEGQSLEIDAYEQFTQGYGVKKWKNVKQNGEDGENNDGVFCATNIPVFRLADAYLMLAEFDLRISGAVTATSQGLVNQVRARSNAKAHNGSWNYDFLLEERNRELYWEGHRRTDLIRFGKFTQGMSWPFKGGSKEGTDVANHFALYPIPAADLGANPNLTQNQGY